MKPLFLIFIFSIIFLNISFSQHDDCRNDLFTMTYTSTFNQCNTNPWVLVFEDDFDEVSINRSKWNYGWNTLYCNPEQQLYTEGQNIEINNSILSLITKKETVYGLANEYSLENEILYCDGISKGKNGRYFEYTSGNLISNRQFSYGKFEARVKIPKGKGFWPAFWLFSGGPWNEIDIFEFWSIYRGNYNVDELSRRHFMSNHYEFDTSVDKFMCQENYLGDDFSSDFHVFTLIWDKDKIEWYVDGVLKKTEIKNYLRSNWQIAPCQINAYQSYLINRSFPIHPMNIILNLAIQNGDGAPDNDTEFPSSMEVDWVKYYMRSDCLNKTITNANQLILDNVTYNTIIGNNVVFDCNYNINPGQDLEIIAKESVILNSGFSITNNSNLIIKTNSTICD